jgi:hypothetical protein
MNKKLILEIIDELLNDFFKIRARFPSIGYDKIGQQRLRLPAYFQKKGLDAEIDFGSPLSRDDITGNNDLAHWINQNVLIRLYSILNSFQIIGDRIAINKNMDGSRELDFLRRLRNQFTHNLGELNTHNPEQVKLATEINEHFKLGITDIQDFDVSIDKVIEPIFSACKKYVESFEVFEEPNNNIREKESFFKLGTEYYISGRYALFAGLSFVAGNLFHHAIEMFLKGFLSSHYNLKVLRRFGHDLIKPWEDFKSRSSLATLTEFDAVISDLNKFEDIRYPDRILRDGLSLSISPTQQTKVASLNASGSQVPSYYLTWEEIDKLVKTIFEESSINPQFFIATYRDSARQFLLLNNAFPII